MDQKTFTESFNNLQRVATEIGRQATTLEDALKMFDEGMKEAEYLRTILDQADQKISIYKKGDE